ncbi:hypothetical protein Tco_1354292 [Tanacetum coccineum]
MFHNLDQLRLQLERENLQWFNAKDCLQHSVTQFNRFLLASKVVNATDRLNQGLATRLRRLSRTGPVLYRRSYSENLDTLEAVIP